MRTFHKLALLSLFCASASFAQLIDTGDLGGNTCLGVAVNSSGTVTGSCRTTAGNFVAFILPAGSFGVSGIIQALPTAAAGQPCSVMDINDNGVIDGNCELASGQSVPVRWQAGFPTPSPEVLQPLTGGANASAGAINQSGVIAGVSISGSTSQAVIWPGGSTTATALPLPGLLGLGTIGCNPADLNDTTSPGPSVAGTCSFTDGTTHAFIWTPTGLLGTYVATQLNSVSGGTNCTAVDINANGQVAGVCQNSTGKATAVRWPAGGVTPLSLDTTLGASTNSTAVAINASGVMAGNYVTAAGDRHCYFWNPNNGVINDLGLLPGGTWCKAVDINSQNNTIAGTAETTGGVSHAFVWRQATGIVDLGTLGGANSVVSDINDNSLVVGTSQASGSGNKARAFYANPYGNPLF